MGARGRVIADRATAEGAERDPAAGRPVLAGEVLFDVFPDGSRVLGGAPLNVAWHLEAFGLEPLLVTRVGDDELGAEVLRAMEGWGLDLSGVQIDGEAPTGRVRVGFDTAGPSFEIAPDQAWDRLDPDAALAAVRDRRPALLYHGSLAARSDPGRATLRALRELDEGPVFIDVNLRDPWWSPGRVAELLGAARWAKLNRDELRRLAAAPPPPAAASDLERTASRFADLHELDQVVVTCGGDGAFLWTGRRWLAGRPPLAVELVDTVGAGDAFSAVWIAGLIGGWPPELTLARALEFAAALCAVRGATTPDRRIHDRYRRAWEHE
ncbi:MAG: PfkB family carbohydrate kinase [Thermoanaerobaculales bacterium]|jgi:fructokinase|nr:PfkB family carbohydrate kinase [Thermoanaerobaculales bacterium]